MVAYKKLKSSEFNNFLDTLNQARNTLCSERSELMQRAYNSMEQGLTLLGVTAVEDRLQESVEDTLKSLRRAGIKICILTGDKVETAENVAFSCGHFKSGTRVLRLTNCSTIEDCSILLMNLE